MRRTLLLHNRVPISQLKRKKKILRYHYRRSKFLRIQRALIMPGSKNYMMKSKSSWFTKSCCPFHFSQVRRIRQKRREEPRLQLRQSKWSTSMSLKMLKLIISRSTMVLIRRASAPYSPSTQNPWKVQSQRIASVQQETNLKRQQNLPKSDSHK